ncbi:GTP-ase activating protein for Arf containing protein [Dirofilaria immitis]|nr:GTP-ase activating protein for Arf containing protein [Dirofilaria immitis]
MIANESEGSYGAMLSSFTTSVKADLDSPVTSNFGNRIVEYRAEAQRIVDEADGYAMDFERLRKAAKRSESQYESDVAVILMKMECHIKDEADLTNLQMRNWQNNIVNPFLTLVEIAREIRNRGVERSCRDYENKYMKAEADARKHAKHAGYTRSQLSHGELAEQLARERLMVQYELCKFLMSVDTIEDRRGPQLLRHFMELVRNQNSYYVNRVRVNEDFRQDMTKLEERMMIRNANRCAQRNMLWDLRSQLEANGEFARCSGRRSSGRDSVNLGSRLSGVNLISSSNTLLMDNDLLSELATSTAFFPDLDFTQSGYLYKKSNKKLHKQWQKRRCRIEDGHFWLSHSDESVPPTKLSLLVSDCKPSVDDPKSFDLYCRERTYHLQADSETDAKRWILALKREITRVKTKMLSAETPQGNEGGGSGAISEAYQRKMCITKVRQLPGNSMCADCSSKEDVQWLSNIGALVCIACSGVHRELGVHVSRIQSLNLDVISPLEFFVPLSSGNVMINHLFEYDAAKCATWKPIPGCTRHVQFDRQRFIQMKYRDRAFVQKLDDPDASLAEAFNDRDFESAYRALLSPNLTRKPFLRNGPFHQMVLSGVSSSLLLADLVMQLRIEISDMEAIMMDCIRHGNADMVAVLLRYRPLNSTVYGIHLHSLIACSEKTQQKKITEMLRSLQSGDIMQVQNVTVPPILFISTPPDSASLSRSSSSISPCPHLPSDSTTQNFTSKPVNVLMRNGATISVPHSSSSIKDTEGNHSTKQISVENETASCLPGENVVRVIASGSPLLDTCAHNSTQPSSFMNSDDGRDLMAFEVPLCTSTPSSSTASTHVTALPNYDQFDRKLLNMKIIVAADFLLNVIPVFLALPPFSNSSNFSDRMGTVRSLPGHLAPQTDSAKDNVKATSSSSDQATSNFISCDEHACSFPMKSLAANGLQQEMPRYLSRNTRLTRPTPALPALIGVKLKPPIPAPRRFPSITRENKQRDCIRRCRALYDCKADNFDELSFRQGDIIIITKEKITGENDTWMEGYLENNPLCRGVFPTTFVTFLS